jgi:superfamily II DNA or RNA helicase
MNMLFAPAPREIVLRQYQLDAVQRLRDGIRANARRQVLVAPTGSGKTEMAMNIVSEAQKKGARAWFIVDRIALIDQTSDRFAQYGIDHGIIQADHWLTDGSKPVQIASAQTLARRKLHELPDLIVIDECHCRFKSTTAIVDAAASAKVIGLTATPFTAGMAEDWDGIVNTTTVNKLLADGYLTPLKIKACVSPDMTGAKKKFTGEYEDEEAGSRGITIIGDVVQTWVEQTRKHFGGPAKTIYFRPQLCMAPNSAGSFPTLATTSNRYPISTRMMTSAAPRSRSSESRIAISMASYPVQC